MLQFSSTPMCMCALTGMKVRLPAPFDKVSSRVPGILTRAYVLINHPGKDILWQLRCDAFIPERDLGNELFRSNQVVQLKTVKLLHRCTAIAPRSVVRKNTYLACTSKAAIPSISAPDEVRMCLLIKRKLGHYKALTRQRPPVRSRDSHTRIAASHVLTLGVFDLMKPQASSLLSAIRSPHSLSKVLGM